MADMLDIGISGILAFQSALTVTSQNIENVHTAYYSRRQVELSSIMFNDGVDIKDVKRVYSGFASSNLLQANAAFGMSDIYLEQLTQISSFMGNDKNNINTYLNDSLTGLRELTNHADSVTNRSLYLQQLKIMSERFNAVGQQLDTQQKNINSSIQTITESVSGIAKNIAALNQQITNAKGGDLDALLDQREALVQQLGTFVDVSYTVDDNNQINVMLSNGASLVVSDQSYDMTVQQDPSNSSALRVYIASGSGKIDVTNFIKGGQLGGLYKTQTDLQTTLNSLNRLAMGIMDQFNQQNHMGIDATGQFGADIFANINGSNFVSQRTYANTANTGSEGITVDINNVNQLTTSDYQLVFDTATHYKVTRISDNTVVSTGAVGSLPQQITLDGFSINLNSGTINAGDRFTISPTRGMSEGMRLNDIGPSGLALAWPVSTTQNSKNGSIEVTDITNPSGSAFATPGQLSPPIKVVFTSATTYQLRDAGTDVLIEDNLVYNPATGSDIFPTAGSYDPGYRVHLSGDIQSGDTFNLNYNTNTQSDIRNGQKLIGLYSKGVFEGSKNLSFGGAYNLFFSTLAIQTNSANTAFKGDKIVLDSATTKYSQVSGVSIAEESTNLARYNEAYQASAQVIEVAKSIFDTIIGLGRR